MDIIKEIERLKERVDEHEAALHALADAPVPPPTKEDHPELEAWPENAFRPNLGYIDTGVGPVAGPGPTPVRWDPKPNELPSLGALLASYRGFTDRGMALPPAEDVVNLTFVAHVTEYGEIELLYPDPIDTTHNPYGYLPLRVYRFRDDPDTPEDMWGSPDRHLAQMVRGSGGVLRFDATKNKPIQDYLLREARLRVGTPYRVMIDMRRVPPGSRLRMVSLTGSRPEEPAKPDVGGMSMGEDTREEFIDGGEAP